MKESNSRVIAIIATVFVAIILLLAAYIFGFNSSVQLTPPVPLS